MNNKIRYNSSMAEFIGIMLGDGSLCLREYNKKQNNRLKISFNSKDDEDYIVYVNSLVFNLFKIKPKVVFRKNENTAEILIFKKKIILFLLREIGLRLSPKRNNAVIPKAFLNNNLDIFVLRGYFDTDGCLATTNNNGAIYPRLEMKVCPSPMQNQFIDILTKYNFKFGVYDIGKGKVRIQLNGKKQLEKWIKIVGFSNTKHKQKIKRVLH